MRKWHALAKIYLLIILMVWLISHVICYIWRNRSPIQIVYETDVARYANATWPRRRIPRVIHHIMAYTKTWEHETPPQWNTTFHSVLAKNVGEFEHQANYRDKIKRKLIYVPSSMIKSLLVSYHDNPLIGNHFAVKRTLDKIHQQFWWSNMKNSVIDHIKSFIVCQAYNTSRPANLPIDHPPTPFTFPQHHDYFHQRVCNLKHYQDAVKQNILNQHKHSKSRYDNYRENSQYDIVTTVLTCILNNR
ncbi:unnamed protein product [Rotaria sp. Silwood2]|nr:unnamed protein product [Rotaria sp. Silwood2]